MIVAYVFVYEHMFFAAKNDFEKAMFLTKWFKTGPVAIR